MSWDHRAIDVLLRFARKNSGPWDDAEYGELPYEGDGMLIATASELLEASEWYLEVIETESALYNMWEDGEPMPTTKTLDSIDDIVISAKAGLQAAIAKAKAESHV